MNKDEKLQLTKDKLSNLEQERNIPSILITFEVLNADKSIFVKL